MAARTLNTKERFLIQDKHDKQTFLGTFSFQVKEYLEPFSFKVLLNNNVTSA